MVGMAASERSKRNHADESNGERVSRQQRQDGKSNKDSDRRTRASTTQERKSRLKRSCNNPRNEGRASKRPKRNGQNPSLSPHETSEAADPTPIGEPVAIQPLTTQGSGATAAKRAKARSICHSAPKKIRSKSNMLGEGGPR